MDDLRRWYARGGKHLVGCFIVVFAVLAGLWCLMAMVGAVCPTILELAVPKSLHGAFHWLGLIGKTEKVYYDDGGLCYEKHYIPAETEWLHGSRYKPYGRWVSVSPDGDTKYVLHFPNPNGKWVEWYPSGGIHYENNYLDGKRHGFWRGWEENGVLGFEWHYVNDDEDGKQTVYFENGAKASEEFCKHGRMEGKRREWYEDGTLRHEQEVLNGETIYDKSYAPDGRLAAELRGPKPTGKWVTWYGNGQKRYEGYYLEGEQHGKCTYWYSDGRLNRMEWNDRGLYEKTPSEELRAWQARMEESESDKTEKESQEIPGTPVHE